MGSMERIDLLASLEATFERCLATAKRKNADYAGDADPFMNFRRTPSGVSVAQGILVRLGDKMQRIDNLLTKPPSVTEESVTDTIEDAINYLGILKAWREEEAKDKGPA